ncbi:hypothetical protein VTO58DRAFT_106072 [Aureobasidium pullulans]
MAQNNEVAAKEPNNLLAKIGLLTSCLDAKINPYGPYTKASKKTPEWVASRLEGLIKDLAAKKDYFEIKYFEAMSKKLKLESQNLKLESEKRKLEHRIQDLTFLLCKHDTSTPAAISFSPTDSELSDESDC